jgi:SAM-dependent methyltransferase
MSAFDVLAPDYDDAFTHSTIGSALRQRVHHRLLSHFHAGDHVLELGCGTGEDARTLSQHGIQITATDASAGMLEVARRKNADQPLIRFAPLDLQQPALPHHSENPFDGVFSNFGALNCLPSRRPLAAWLADRIRPGGVAAFGIMAPCCLWEIIWHSLHLDGQIAFRRLRGSASFLPAGAPQALSITYPSVSTLTAEFSPWFERISIRPLGWLLPPTALYPVLEKRPRLLRLLTRWDEHSSSISALANLADHYWIELRRK